MKRLVAFLMALALLVPAALAASEKYEGEGFASAEAAIQAYVEAFNAGDVPGMLSTFAIETVAEHMDPVAYAQRVRAFVPNAAQALPVIDDYTRGLAAAKRMGELSTVLTQQYLSYAWPADHGSYEGMSVPLKEDLEIEAFYEGFAGSAVAEWPGQIAFAGLEPLAAISADAAGYYESESGLALREKILQSAGGDELFDGVARVRILDADYLLFMECVRYGERWYNFALGGLPGSAMGLPINLGGLVPAGELQ